MKTLVISPTPTHPTTAGNRARILALLAGLEALGHEPHLAWVPLEDGDRQAMHHRFGSRFHELAYHPPTSLWPKARRRALAWLGSPAQYVWGIDDWYDGGLDVQLQTLQAQHQFNAVCVEYVFLSRALRVFPASVRKLIDTHDRFADRHLQYLRAGKKPEWFSTTVEGEREGLGRADVVLAIQSSEASEFNLMLEGRRVVLTVGHLLHATQPAVLGNLPRATFVASANSINVDAATAFVTQALPIIRARRPDFELILAGDVCAQLPDAHGVRKLGRVDDVRKAYESGMLAINPVRMGTGLNIKTMECLALGMPLVCTESGSRGLEDLRNRAFVCVPTDDAQQMASAVLALLDDDAARSRLRAAALEAARAWNAKHLTCLQRALGLDGGHHEAH